MSIIPIGGLPRIGALKTASHRTIFLQAGPLVMLAGGRMISGTYSRDPSNGDPTRLQPGLVMGKRTSGSLYANSIIGLSTGALTSTGTTLASSAAIATELNRRIGATGTFKLTGPPTAAGTVRTLTLTYSALNLSTGDITVTATGVNAVFTLNFANSPAGTFRIRATDLNGVRTTSGPITYSGTAATLVSNINTALNTAFGSSLLVASGSAVTAIAITFSGAGYTALPQADLVVDSDGLTAGTVAVTNTTAGVDGRFVTGSLIQPTDGSETPLLMLPDGYAMPVTDYGDGTNQDQPFPEMPVWAIVESSKLINYPADASLRTWLQGQLSTATGGKYTFDTAF